MRPQRADGNAGPQRRCASTCSSAPAGPCPARAGWRGTPGVHAANGLIGLVLAATGPVAVILAVGAQGGSSQGELASWGFGALFLDGVLTVVACWLSRQPLASWTIPGTVLVGPAPTHLPRPPAEAGPGQPPRAPPGYRRAAGGVHRAPPGP